MLEYQKFRNSKKSEFQIHESSRVFSILQPFSVLYVRHQRWDRCNGVPMKLCFMLTCSIKFVPGIDYSAQLILVFNFPGFMDQKPFFHT